VSATRRIVLESLLVSAAWSLVSDRAAAQGPTIHTPAGAPGSMSSSLGPTPGAGASPFGLLPGAGEMVLGGGRPGPSFPRVPASISTPSIGMGAPARLRGITAPEPLPLTRLDVLGTLALPEGTEEEGPPDGLTLDQALERLVRHNLYLRSSEFEIPQARADVLTASLRANPILYADAQLQPYGQYSRSRPGGPPQYDVNVSHPLDLSGKRQARTAAAERALNVLEAQFQNAVRLQIDNLYVAYVDVLAARETARFAQASVAGLDKVVTVTETLYKRSDLYRPDVLRVRMQKEAAEVGVQEARDRVRRATQSLAVLLAIPPEQAQSLELRGTIAIKTPPLAATDEFVSRALQLRPDLMADRLGVQRALADIRQARAERFADVYVLYQPYTFQDNSPLGQKSATSWALGVTVPVPIYNRNQGGILRANQNVTQMEISAAGLERRIATEVAVAARECAVSAALVKHFEETVLPAARAMLDDSLRLFVSGEQNALAYFNVQREYNQAVRQYRDALVRHRRSMLALNTAVGQRILP
jgi:cobalt-zinc-cadmium efflux system outer membrane protein